MEFPAQLRYSEDHMWVRVDGTRAVVGLTAFADDELGMIVFAELPEVGDELKKGQPLGSIESVKTVTELYAPVSGKVEDINRTLVKSPEKINESPYAQGWLVTLELSDPGELDSLWTADRYRTAYGGGDGE